MFKFENIKYILQNVGFSIQETSHFIQVDINKFSMK